MTLTDSDLFIQAQSGTGQCGVVDLENAGYLSTDQCSKNHPYVCTYSPLFSELDNACPSGFYPYRDKCLFPDSEPVTYDEAVVSETLPNYRSKYVILVTLYGRKLVPTEDPSFYPSKRRGCIISSLNWLRNQVDKKYMMGF